MFLMLLSMFFNANVEILMGDGNTTLIKVYIYFLYLLCFGHIWTKTYVHRKVKKNHLSLCTHFVYLHVGHVSVLSLDMLHQCTYCYIITTLQLKKLRKGQPKLEHKIIGTNVVGKHQKPFLQNVILGYHMKSTIVETY